MKKQLKRQRFPVKPIIIAIIIFVLSYSLVVYSSRSYKNLSCFKIKDVILNPKGDIDNNDFVYLKGANTFDIDLAKESKRISCLYPNYDKVRLIRVLPDRIFVDFIMRKPVAYIKLAGLFYVDEKFVFWKVTQEESLAELPVILGLDKKIILPVAGRQYNIQELNLALNIIKNINYRRALNGYKVSRLDVRDLNGISCYIPLKRNNGREKMDPSTEEASELEIKIGPLNIVEKLDILASLFKQLSKDLVNIKYIDLRFKEPVIKLNDAK